ncbi:ribulose-phosphate 3-epimerase [Brachyspira catarrhinii]|uniref:Epimerase n=1 Tax=Brachyspira catarrhinii TaxID=2528966 RepID=A0ABY2TQB9_9SPIR|nr:epimerase [Brachyspira catarrhinii]TKZ34824.1 epimerase [Brachyspira catarrhinii]
MINISPSIASSNLLDIKNEIKKVEDFNSYTLHIDIEDGNFVPNITFGIKLINMIREQTKINISYHLMVTNPLFWIYELPLRDNDIVFAHVESYQYPKYIVNSIKNRGANAGIVFNPATSIEQYKYLVSVCENIMIMTSEPDKDGEYFIDDMTDKILIAQKLQFKNIWVDGGIDKNRIETLNKIGVSNFIVGRYFFNNDFK